ncbi:MAG: hypothetical protein GX657_05420 [Chloroflexi bacterium]|nr:hypothetical protein [Chloroflexota bacterium]
MARNKARPAAPWWSAPGSPPTEEQLHGQVRDVIYSAVPRQFADAVDRLSFHVMSVGEGGHVLGATRVEVHSARLRDLLIRDGDLVTVSGTRAPHGELLAQAVTNHTTRTRLALGAARTALDRWRAALGVLSFVAVPAFILALISLVCGRLAEAVLLGVPCLAVWALWLRQQGKAA